MKTISVAGEVCHRDHEEGSFTIDASTQLFEMNCTLPSASGLLQNVIAHYGYDGLYDSHPKPLVSYAPAQITSLACNGCNSGDDDGEESWSYEWGGVFTFDSGSLVWSMQADDEGNYPHPSMLVVFIPTAEPTEDTMHSLEEIGETLITGNCSVINDGDTLTPGSNGSCFELAVSDTSNHSTFNINATGISGMVIFAQHVPIEFERDIHYLYTLNGVDIAPIAEEGGDHNVDQLSLEGCPREGNTTLT